jgi:hypothetical protein
MMRRFLSVRILVLAGLVTSLAFIAACSDNKSSEQTSSSSPPQQASSSTPPKHDVSKSSPGSNAATDQSIAQYFANSKPVAPASAARPTPKGDLSFTLDIADVVDRVVRVRGWAFRLTPPHQVGDRVTILLVGSAGAYSTVADVENRPDVSAVLKQPGMDDTGFVSLIDTSAVPPGEYTLFLRVGGADGEAIKGTNRTLTL